MSNGIIDLIRAYRKDVDYVIRLLHKAYSYDNLLAAHHTGQIPKSGVLENNVEYSFHGAGCRFIFGPREVDVEFGLGGNWEGFDSWRLYLYSKTSPEFLGVTQNAIELELRDLLCDKIIAHSPPPNENLFILSKNDEGV